MRAVYLQSHGQPDSLVVGERPEPQPGLGDVRVRVLRAALNHVDLYMHGGGQGITHDLPLILGVDCIGEIESVGAGVDPSRVGETVALYPYRFDPNSEFSRRGDIMLCNSAKIIGEHIDGAYADFVTIPAICAVPIGDGVDLDVAAALPTSGLTSWRMVFTQGQVQPHHTVLIHGIGGAVSLTCMLLCKLAGARVIVTSSSDGKLERACGLGADVGVNYSREDVLGAVMAATDGRGVDVTLENVGRATWPVSLRATVRGGRIVTCGATTGGNADAEIQRIFIRQLQIYGATMGNLEEFRAMWSAFQRGAFAPVVDSTFDLEGVPDAHARLRAEKQFGKIVIKVS